MALGFSAEYGGTRLIPLGLSRAGVIVSIKTARSRVGGPELWVLDRWVTGDKEDGVYPGSGPPMEVKPYVLLCLY